MLRGMVRRAVRLRMAVNDELVMAFFCLVYMLRRSDGNKPNCRGEHDANEPRHHYRMNVTGLGQAPTLKSA
jgi:hypothetical protein